MTVAFKVRQAGLDRRWPSGKALTSRHLTGSHEDRASSLPSSTLETLREVECGACFSRCQGKSFWSAPRELQENILSHLNMKANLFRSQVTRKLFALSKTVVCNKCIAQLVSVLYMNRRLYFTLGPVQDRLQNKLITCFRGRRIHLSTSEMSEISTSGFTSFWIGRLPDRLFDIANSIKRKASSS